MRVTSALALGLIASLAAQPPPATRAGADGAPDEAVHDRAVHGHDLRHRRVVLRRRDEASCSRRTRPASSTSTRVPVAGGEPTRVTASTTDTTFAVSYFPQGRPHPLHARPGRQRAEPPLRARRRTARSATSRPGEKLKAQFAGWTPDGRRLLRQHQRARPALLRPLPLRREDLRAHAALQERAGLPSRARSRTTGSGSRSTKPNTTVGQRHLPLERRTRRRRSTSRRTRASRRTQPPAFDRDVDAPLLPDQRRRRVHAACAATTSRRARTRTCEKADWDIAVHVVLAQRAGIASPASTRTAAPSSRFSTRRRASP